jgi:hypothetical protein
VISRRVFPVLLLAVLACTVLVPEAAPPTPQSDLDAFMAKVLARRDENWKKLQQYILDERETVEVRGPTKTPVWGERRTYSWFIKDGYFIRSPLTANGVTISESDRRKYEDSYIKRVKARERRQAERDKDTAPSDQPPSRGPDEMPTTLDGLLQQTRQPQFIDTAYFLKFKFEQGKYAFVGKEKLEGQDVLRVEYYPARLFTHEQDKETKQKSEKKSDREQAMEAQMERMMNKVSLVTIWVEPVSYQIVKYTFDNVNFDFLPVAWLMRVSDLKAVMTMSQPFKDVWLPRDVEIFFGALLAVGAFDIRYHLDYYDYREATTSARIKRGGGPGPW